jgi:hypothetical protein
MKKINWRDLHRDLGYFYLSNNQGYFIGKNKIIFSKLKIIDIE